MRARVAEKREVARDTLMVVFDPGGQEVSYKPGQYFWVELLDPPYDDERGARRHISIVTSPTERGVLGLCTRLRDSAFKRSLAELPVGAEVEVEEPKGRFVLPPSSGGPYVFLAGGIGITVFRSMLRYVADRGLPHRITLVYSNRDRAAAPFLEELVAIEREHDGIRLVLTMTDDPGWEGERRRIGPDLLRDHLDGDLAAYEYLVAGPPAMADAVVESLTAAGVPEERVRADRFSGY